MVVTSKAQEEYFNSIEQTVYQIYNIASEARSKGLDPSINVESPIAKDLAGRVETLIGPEGIANRIRELKAEGFGEDEIVFEIASEILEKKIGNIKSKEERVDRAIRAALAIKTQGVVSAPLEGISRIIIRKDNFGNSYLSLYFSGPIRAAGGTTTALCVLLADLVRKKMNIPKYEASEGEIGRMVEEIKLYSRILNLQYPASNEEIRFAVKNLPVEINGDPTEKEEVSAFRDLPRIETNKIRGGACLVLNDGIIAKKNKLQKITQNMKLSGWEWLDTLINISKSIETEKDEELKKSKNQRIKKSEKFIADIIAGRPVFGYPSEIGGHRIRFGRSRNSGLAACGLNPVTMVLLDRFLAVGTQVRTERPGKSASIVPVSSIEPPIVLLKNGDVIKVKTEIIASEIFKDLKKILFLGDILISYGDFVENNKILTPSGYCEEWWALELKNAIENYKQKVKLLNIPEEKLNSYITDCFKKKPSAQEAIIISKILEIPLHPEYLDFWENLILKEIILLREYLIKSYNKGSLALDLNPDIKLVLEKAFIPHRIKDNKIVFSKAKSKIYEEIFNLKSKEDLEISKISTIFDFFYTISSIKVKIKAPHYIGTRMGRPEKSEEKKMKPPVHVLFPLSKKVGNSRSIQKALELGKIKIDICRKRCPSCKNLTIFNLCDKCRTHTEFQKYCPHCNYYIDASNDHCPKCNGELKNSTKVSFNIKNYIDSIIKKMNRTLPNVKGVYGLTNLLKVAEPLEKGILRAIYEVFVYKDGTIRYDATDLPLTHFKPKEISTSIKKLVELGYSRDIYGKNVENDDQILELKVQDIILSEHSAKYFVKVANFIDDELKNFYNLKPFYNIKEISDLIGQLFVGLAPHTSAGIIGRVIGFSSVNSIYAHPFWHAAKRRNCDGDEDGLMLLMDCLLNFSLHYLPSKIGGKMDEPLVISIRLDPNEIDSEAHNIDTLYQYPLKFYEATESYRTSTEILGIMELVKDRLGTKLQFEQLGFTHPTESINAGPHITAYKLYEKIDEKIEAQLNLAKIINAVDAQDVARRILKTHFTPDILGNLRSFTNQNFRCVKCNEKYRKPPLYTGGICKCGGKIILTVNRGGIEKYIPRSLKIINEFNLDSYTKQRMELVESYVKSVANNPKIRQHHLSDFF
jgi:DNA polymerase II large subunit